MDPAGPAARDIAQLWWWMLGYGSIVWLVVIALWCYALLRSSRQRDEASSRRTAARWIWGGGVLLPFVSIALLLAFGMPAGRAPVDAGVPPLHIEVTGYRWGWEVRYPAAGRQLAGELVLPVGRAVAVDVSTRDVIHGFWVPRLGVKVDAIPGRTHRVHLRADRAGVFHAPCAEFCGPGHAHMSLRVQALPAEEFERWLHAKGPTAAPASTPARAPAASTAPVARSRRTRLPATRPTCTPNSSASGATPPAGARSPS